MKRILLLLLLMPAFAWAQLPMGGWQMHNAYGSVTRVENGIEKVYALSYGALMSVDKEDGEMQYYNKLTGLSSSNIVSIKYDNSLQVLVVVYADGNIDLLTDDGEVVNITDLYTSQSGVNKHVNEIAVSGRTAYMSTTFGIMEVDLLRRELKNTYYIGEEAAAVEIGSLAVCGDSLFALSADVLYSAAEKQNKTDFRNWTRQSLPGSGSTMGLQAADGFLWLLRDSVLYCRTAEGWQTRLPASKFYTIRSTAKGLIAIGNGGFDIFSKDELSEHMDYFIGSSDIVYDAFNNTYWYAYGGGGIGRLDATTHKYDRYKPNGPAVNIPYRLSIAGKRLYVVQGGHAGIAFERSAVAMYYEDGEWTNFNNQYFATHLGEFSRDYSDIKGDPNDPSHFFIASFSNGLIEFRNNEFYRHHNAKNSPLIAIFGTDPGSHHDIYTWVDGIALDKQGNLWMMNMNNAQTMKVLTADGKWYTLDNEATHGRFYVNQMIIPDKYPNIKIVVYYRDQRGIGMVDDNGTIGNQADDRSKFRSTFVDQMDKTVSPDYFFCAVEDLNGEVWVGTSSGPLIIPDPDKFFTSDECQRSIIQRTDGSGLADYLLKDEQINAIAVDGANRKWIGTQNSGVYLVSPDGSETIQHFTIDNSPLPDNTILSLAVEPESGMVYIGTGVGLISYQSNAAAAHDDFAEIYAYPNPVREDFDGLITIAGLMDNSIVKITDSAGQLVAETTSLGGIATWDGKDVNGKHVRTGVYMAQCVSEDGQHALAKILVIH